MKFSLNITELGNAAFGTTDLHRREEIARILREVAIAIEYQGTENDRHQNMRDTNGNVVGTYVLK